MTMEEMTAKQKDILRRIQVGMARIEELSASKAAIDKELSEIIRNSYSMGREIEDLQKELDKGFAKKE